MYLFNKKLMKIMHYFSGRIQIVFLYMKNIYLIFNILSNIFICCEVFLQRLSSTIGTYYIPNIFFYLIKILGKDQSYQINVLLIFYE